MYSHSSLSLLHPSFGQGWGIALRGEGDVDKGGGGNDNFRVLETVRGDRYKVLTQLPIPHTHLPRERKRRGGGEVENGRKQLTNR